MKFRKRLGELDLVWVLLAVMVAEVAINRLTIPALRPPGDIRPPGWHRNLDLLGLFFYYLASTLALGVLVQRLWRAASRKDLYVDAARVALAPLGLGFMVLAIVALARTPTPTLSFAFETSFTLTLLLLLSAQFNWRGDVLAKVGMVVMAIPLVVHFYGPFALRVLMDEETAMWSSLPDRVREAGQSALVLAALLSPYCFSPRPFRDAATRLAPLAVAGFVGLIGAVIMRQHFEVGMLVASRGLGVEVGPAAPVSLIALYLLALASITWTLASCLTAESHARRLIGAGIGLVVAGGYAFAWPLQFLVSLVGMLVIGEGARWVTDEERAGAGAGREFRTPPVRGEIWQAYLSAAVDALGEGASAVTVQKDAGIADTHLHAVRRGVRVDVRVVRAVDAIQLIEVLCGEEPPEQDPPWTLHARPERLLGLGAHPEPPQTSAATVKTGDHPFDRRFRVRDRERHTGELLDEPLRARATAVLDGWLAYWPGRTLRYRVYPGRGAPIDHPIPITELAFRGEAGAATPERLVALVDLLAEMSARAKVGA